MTRRKKTARERAWDKEKQELKIKMAIEKEKNEILADHKKRSTTKAALLYIFAVATIIEIVTGILMIWQMRLAQLAITTIGSIFTPDFSPQVVLISGLAAQVISFTIYCVKATRENTNGGITYLNAMHEIERSEYGNINNNFSDPGCDTSIVSDNFPGSSGR